MSSIEDKIPEGWVETTLKKVGKVVTGKTPSKNHPEDWGKIVDFITPTEISSDLKYISETPRKLSLEGKDRFSRMILPKKSVIVTCIGSDMGKVVMNYYEALTNQQINSVIVNEKNSSDFIFYLFKNSYRLLRRYAEGSGSTMPILNKSNFESLHFVLPPLQEQKAIAQVLTAFDDKIENLRAQNQTLETLAQTIFREWFGKYQVGDELPEGWRVGKITELFEVRDGTHDSPKEQSVGFKLITSKHLDNNRLLIEDAYFISENDYNQVNKRSKVEKYDILFSMIGTIGLAYFELNDKIDYAIKNVALFKCSQNKQWANYTYLWLTSFLGKHFIATNKSGSTQEYVSLTSLRNIDFIIPVERKLIDFNKIMNPIFEKILSNSKQLQTLTQTRDTLLPKLMSGQLRVKEFNKYTRIKNYGRTI